MNYSVVSSSLTMFLSALLSLSLVLISSVSMMTVVESFVLPATTTTTTTITTTTTTPTNNIFLQVDTTTTHTRSNTRHPRGKNTAPFYAASTTTIDSGNQNADADTDADANSLLLQQIEDAKQILYRAAETKQEDADVVVDALVTLEKLSRQANKADPTRSEQTLAALAGVSSSASASSAAAAASTSKSNSGGVSWRLIFTTGTIDTQRKLGGTKINYFPLKATQSFDNTQAPWMIQNGIYAPFFDDFALLKFEGDFDWTFTAPTGLTKVTFDFNRIQLFNGLLDIPLKKGEAASLGAKSGLGSDNNIKLTKKGKRPFFQWISADARIATARGGGGGIALWKRI